MSDRGSIEHTIAHEEGWQNLLGAKTEIMVLPYRFNITELARK